MYINSSRPNPPIMLKILPIMLLKNFTYYVQIMLIDIEQFPEIYSAIVSIWSIDYKS